MKAETKSEYPSVTRILSNTQDQRTKDALAKWRIKVGDKEADRLAEAGLQRGRKLDELIQLYVKEGETGDVEIDAYLEHFDIHSTEQTVVSEQWGYKGRLDAVLVNDGNTFIVDWKTKGKPMNGQWLNDYPLQLSAYCKAYEEGGSPYRGAMIVVFSPSFPIQQVQEFYFSPNQMQIYFTEFKVRLKQYQQEKLAV